MSVTGLEVLDTTLRKTSEWIDTVMSHMDTSDRHRAYSALRGVLHTLRDRLTVGEAADLGAQLPMLIKGIYYEGWRPAGKPQKYRHKQDFLDHLAKNARGFGEAELEDIARAVFSTLSEHVSAGEIEQARDQLPSEVRELWPS